MTMRIGKSFVHEETSRAVLMVFGEWARGECGRRSGASRRIVRWWSSVERVERVRKKRYWRTIGRVVIWRWVVECVGEDGEGEVRLWVVRDGGEIEGEGEGNGGEAFSTRAQVR